MLAWFDANPDGAWHRVGRNGHQHDAGGQCDQGVNAEYCTERHYLLTRRRELANGFPSWIKGTLGRAAPSATPASRNPRRVYQARAQSVQPDSTVVTCSPRERSYR